MNQAIINPQGGFSDHVNCIEEFLDDLDDPNERVNQQNLYLSYRRWYQENKSGRPLDKRNFFSLYRRYLV